MANNKKESGEFITRPVPMTQEVHSKVVMYQAQQTIKLGRKPTLREIYNEIFSEFFKRKKM